MPDLHDTLAFNQPPPFVDVNLYAADRPLREAVAAARPLPLPVGVAALPPRQAVAAAAQPRQPPE